MGYLEGEKSEIHESLYKEYTRLVALSDSGINFKHYCFKDESKSIILKEDTNLISEGTTGLRTWQASLVLSEWILANRCHFSSKIILELGSGAGLTGLVLLLKCKPDAVYLTDCHPSVLKALCDNVSLNLKSKGKTYCEDKLLLKESINSSIVKVFDIPWEDLSADFCQKLGHIDILVAADVVYDKTIFNPLNNAVNCLFENCAIEEFILACTERNSETLEEFLGLLSKFNCKFNIALMFFILGKNYIICDVKVPYQENFLWPRDAPIKIFKITRSK